MHITKSVGRSSGRHLYNNLTEQIPYFVDIALPQEAEKPSPDYSPSNIIFASEKTNHTDIHELIIDNTRVRINSPEKTITDNFKLRKKYRLDGAIDALKRYMALPSNNRISTACTIHPA